MSDVLSTETKFTPGPWVIEDQREMADEIWIGAWHDEVGIVTHASVRAGCGEAEELGSIEANAHLIASATDLYEAMSQKDNLIVQNALVNAAGALHRAGEQELSEQLWKIVEWQCAALLKARGGSSNEGE